ncbi:MAG TPA: PAS domain-containing protein, partial [Flavitalea sp.]|nr:PAS domain-containing protein [Flavitalea sp.]
MEGRVDPTFIDLKIFEAMPVKSILLGTNGPPYSIIAVTGEYAETFKISRNKWVGEEMFSLMSGSNASDLPSSLHRLRASFEEVIQSRSGNTINNFRFDLSTGDKLAMRSWNVINKPVLNSSGNVSHIIHSLVEVDEFQAQTPELLSQAADKTYQLFMNAPVAVCIVKGPDYIVELANEGMLQLLGRQPDMIGRPIIESLPEAGLQGLINILEHVRQTGETYEVSNFPAELMINEVREARFFDLVFKCYQRHVSDAEVSIFCLANNVTEQVRSGQQVSEMTAKLNLRNAIFEAQNQSSSDGVLIVDANGEMILYNRRFAEIWQIPEEVLQSRSDAYALKQAANMLVEPELFLQKVSDIYQSVN